MSVTEEKELIIGQTQSREKRFFNSRSLFSLVHFGSLCMLSNVFFYVDKMKTSITEKGPGGSLLFYIFLGKNFLTFMALEATSFNNFLNW